MINPKKLPEVFGKKHQKTRLETLIRDCWNCGLPRTFVYLGNHGTEHNPKHVYECMSCGIHYVNLKILKGELRK